MKAKQLKEWLSQISDNTEIDYKSSSGVQPITCITYSNGKIYLSNTPYEQKGKEDEISLQSLIKYYAK